MRSRCTQIRRFLENAAWLLALGLVLMFAVMGMVMTAQLRAPEVISYVSGSVIKNLLGLVLMIGAFWILKTVLEKLARIHLTGIVMLIWAVLAAGFLLGAGTRQEVDFLYVCQAAEAFAAGDCGPMSTGYFNEYSYQLGTVFLLEGIIRLVPDINIELFMQAVNAALSIGAAGMLSALGALAFEEKRVRTAAMAMYLLCLPMAIYCIHVYGTLPMMFLSSAAMLCFVLYIKRGKTRFGVLYTLCAALAYMLKPNAAVVLLALLICAGLYAMEHREWRLLGFAVLSLILAAALARLVILQYEWRSGVTLREDVSMLARLVMGLQDGKRAAGWYNGYTEQFFDSAVSMEQEKMIAMQDLKARLQQMAGEPVRTVIFMVQKAVSQWLEPTYGTLLYGDYCRQSGILAEAAQAVFSEESTLRLGLESVMKFWQQALYMLSCVGILDSMRRRRGTMALILPVAVLGGGLYHMIFEAKSQYIYVYAIYLVPVAACGLCVLEDWIHSHAGLIRKRREK